MICQSSVPKALAVVFLLLVVFSACRKDESAFVAYTATSAVLNGLLRDADTFKNTATFDFKGAIPDTVLSGADGYKIHLTNTEALFADADGKVVPCSTCDALHIEIESAAGKGALIAKGLSTLDAEGRLLAVGGALKFSARCREKKLQLYSQRGLRIEVPGSNATDKFFLFEAADFDNNAFSGWKGTGQEAIAVQATSNTAFSVEVKRPGWLNFGRYLPGTTQACYVRLPVEYSGDNTHVYYVLKNEIGVAPMLYDADKRFFRLYEVPLAPSAQVITISKMSDGWRFSRKDIDLNTQNTIDMAPVAVTEKQLLELLATL